MHGLPPPHLTPADRRKMSVLANLSKCPRQAAVSRAGAGLDSLFQWQLLWSWERSKNSPAAAVCIIHAYTSSPVYQAWEASPVLHVWQIDNLSVMTSQWVPYKRQIGVSQRNFFFFCYVFWKVMCTSSRLITSWIRNLQTIKQINKQKNRA